MVPNKPQAESAPNECMVRQRGASMWYEDKSFDVLELVLKLKLSW